MKSPRMKRFLEEERMEEEKKSALPSVGEERIGGAYTLRNNSEEELLREMLTPYIIRVGIKRRKRGGKFMKR